MFATTLKFDFVVARTLSKTNSYKNGLNMDSGKSEFSDVNTGHRTLNKNSGPQEGQKAHFKQKPEGFGIKE